MALFAIRGINAPDIDILEALNDQWSLGALVGREPRRLEDIVHFLHTHAGDLGDHEVHIAERNEAPAREEDEGAPVARRLEERRRAVPHRIDDLRLQAWVADGQAAQPRERHDGVLVAAHHHKPPGRLADPEARRDGDQHEDARREEHDLVLQWPSGDVEIHAVHAEDGAEQRQAHADAVPRG